MADAKKCDRCGAYYDKYGDRDHANAICVENDDFAGKVPCDKKYDLCPSCMAFIHEWLKNGCTCFTRGAKIPKKLAIWEEIEANERFYKSHKEEIERANDDSLLGAYKALNTVYEDCITSDHAKEYVIHAMRCISDYYNHAQSSLLL